MQEINHTANPFPGLRPFESNETHLFFGRDGQSEELLRRLKRTRFLAVVGTSGSGKSSLVRAGLLPALQGGLMASAGSDWRIAILRPGCDPIGNLARALASSAVLGSPDEKDDGIQAVLAETTLRRSSLGLVELVSRARMKLDQHGQPLFPDYENLLVVVDQFEELFRFKQLIEQEKSNEDATTFVKLLLEAVADKAEKIYVVLTMRSDFLGDCSQFWELPEAINKGQYLIPRMTRDERREAISGPVAVGRGTISEPLINQLLNDVGDNPDQLPILQHALMRTWDYWLDHSRNGNPIDIPDYNAIGGMAEALSRHADEAYAELTESQRVIAEKLFKGLTEKGTDNREIRRPMEVQEISDLTGADESAVISVVEVFRREGRSFLMPPSTDALTGAPVPLTRESLIDISHESLIRNWERLKIWVDDESHSARIYKRLAETAMLHQAGEEALLVDPALHGALEWREKNRPNAVWARRYHPEFETAMRFLDQSVAARDAETREREQQRQREARYKRSKWVLVVLGLAFSLSLAALTYSRSQLIQAHQASARAVQQFNSANEEHQRARAQANLAEVKAQAAHRESVLAKEESDTARLAQQVALKEKQQAEQAKAQAVQQKEEAIIEQQKAIEAQRRSLDLLYAADINLAQQAYETSNTARVKELLGEAVRSSNGDTSRFEWHYLSHLLKSEISSRKRPGEGLLMSATSPDGKMLVWGAGREVRLRIIAAGEERPVPLPEDFKVGSLAISLDGTKLAVGSSRSSAAATIEVYDTKTLQPISSLRKDADSANVIVFSPDGKQLFVGGGEGSVSVWNVDASGEPEILPANGTVFLDVSRDGKMLAAGSINKEAMTFPVLLWDRSAKGNQVKELVGHGDKISCVAFSPDGDMLATGSMDKTVKIWDPKTGHPRRVLSFAARVFAVAFSRRGHYLAIGLEDGSIRLYDAIENFHGPTLIGHQHPVTSLSFAAGRILFSSDNKLYSQPEDGKLLFMENSQTTVKEWNVGTLTREQTPFPVNLRGGSTAELEYSVDGKVLIARSDRNMTWIDGETNKPIETAPDRNIANSAVAFSPDGKLIATVDVDRRNDQQFVVIRDVSTRKPIRAPIKPDAAISDLAFSPNSKFLAAPDAEGWVEIWDTTSSKSVATLYPKGSLKFVLSFLTDDRLLTVHADGVVKLWNINSQKVLSEFQLSRKNSDLAAESFAVSPNGRYFAASYDDGIAVLFDDKGKQLATLKSQVEDAPIIAFSSNGRLLATGDYDGTLKLWDTTSHRELLTLRGTPYPVVSISFSRDETKLAILDDHGNVRVWRAPVAAITAAKPSPAGY